MNDETQKPCWIVTAWTVAAFSVFLGIVFLFDGIDTVAMAAR